MPNAICEPDTCRKRLVPDWLNGGPPYFRIADANDPAEMRVNSLVGNCVVYICEKMRGRTRGDPFGTAFIASMEDPDGAYGTYLVTAAHLIEDSNRINGGNVWVRALTRAKKLGTFQSSCDDWVEHADKSVDLAVLDITDVAEGLEYWPVPLISQNGTGFIFSEGRALFQPDIGEAVFVPGLFSAVPGGTSNTPIFRFGNIAANPSEPFQLDSDRPPMHGHLLAMQSIGGMSGSPVFLRPSKMVLVNDVPKGERTVSKETQVVGWPFHFYLLGMIVAHWNWPPANNIEEWAKLNCGVSAVTPAHRMLEVLNTGNLSMARKNRLDDVKAGKPVAVRDTAAPTRGRKPQRLALEGPWEDRVRDSFTAKPKRRKAKR